MANKTTALYTTQVVLNHIGNILHKRHRTTSNVKTFKENNKNNRPFSQRIARRQITRPER